MAGDSPSLRAISLPGMAGAAQLDDLFDQRGWRRLAQLSRPRGTVSQARLALAQEPFDPLGRCFGADAESSRHLGPALAFADPPNQIGSTSWRQARILVNVHPVLPEVAVVSQQQHPRSGPDGQPIESSHLDHQLLILFRRLSMLSKY